MNKPKVIVISIICILILCACFTVYKFYIADDDVSTSITESTVPKLKSKEKFTYQDMMSYRENGENTVNRAKINIQSDTLIDTLNFKIIEAEAEEGLFSNSQEEQNSSSPVPRIEKESKYTANYYSDESSNRASRKAPTKRTSNNDLYNTETYTSAYNEITNRNVSNDPPIQSSLDAKEQMPVELSRRRREGFIGSSNNTRSQGKSIDVIVFGDQVIDQGESLKLRVTNNANINGVSISRNSIAYGIVSKAQNRLNISVSSIQSGGKNIPVNLTAYDATDGMAGLKVAQQEINHTSDNLKNQTGDDILNATGITSLPIIGTIGRGAKDLLTRRKTTTSIVVGNNYKLILK